ncbi:hypothetical protein POF50_030630 [Streptomyces sp. SL13]|jgi:hypothetical protein|uniref:Secreted protein n=1 Tax=Streptantibioticus silvisoli TaxID=2705255 RepID=A0AA90H9I3_9ACTN|nr:hypothetical protein [Streptantibioticus silvisoli]MDI5967734.1 hypothetical protein [Streptantibioticus silvisoli]MDI5973645.1 hypothetical protein [Streptantibioticus silvisoli]
MSTAAIIGIVIACVIVAAIIGFAARTRGSGGTGRLRTRFGPEYDRVLARHDGDEAATREELTGRLERHAALTTRDLDDGQRERYEAWWAGVQERFVDDPARAISEADELVASLLRDRGYPDGDFDALTDAVSVDHPHHVQHYRDSHVLAARTGTGPHAVDTEESREALLRTRELFDELVGTGHRDGDPAAGAGSGNRRTRQAGAPRHRHA